MYLCIYICIYTYIYMYICTSPYTENLCMSCIIFLNELIS